MKKNLIQTQQHHPHLAGPIQHGQDTPSTLTGLGHPAAHGGAARHPTLREDNRSQRDDLPQAQSHRRARGRKLPLFDRWQCFRGGPRRPQRLILVAQALMLVADLVVAGAPCLLPCHGLLDSMALLVDRLTATTDLLGALRNRTPAATQNHRRIANPRCHWETNQAVSLACSGLEPLRYTRLTSVTRAKLSTSILQKHDVLRQCQNVPPSTKQDGKKINALRDRSDASAR